MTAAMATEAMTRERDISESLADMDMPRTWRMSTRPFYGDGGDVGEFSDCMEMFFEVFKSWDVQ